MRIMALDYLYKRLGDKKDLPENLDTWYLDLRDSHIELLFPFLVESVGSIEKVFILEEDIQDENITCMTVEDLTEEKARWLPFIKIPGPQSAQVGPVIKRSYDKKKGGGPSAKILKTTMDSFESIAESGKPWSAYFKEIVDLLNRPQLRLLDNSVLNWKDYDYKNLLAAAVDKIGEQTQTVFLTVRDKDGNLPGQRPEYIKYLMLEKLTGTKYTTGKALAKDNQTCPLCNRSGIPVFPNALNGAGINISNVDREGAFPGLNIAQAWKGYALCNACADLLYVYKFHCLKKNEKNRNAFITPIAGDNAVVIPFFTLDLQARQYFWRKVKDFIKSASSNVEEDELSILDTLKDEKGILNLTFLWATVGQNIENVTGMITDVPPSRLTQISKVNEESENWKHPLFPETFLKIKNSNFKPDLSLRALRPLFYRPGGKKTNDVNASMKLKQLIRSIVASVYHKTEIPLERFWKELMDTAGWYWLDAINKGNGYGLLHEGMKKTGEPFLTAAGWIRHLCWWIYYFKKLEVMKMEEKFYEPEMGKLKPYFGAESGIDSPQKAYAFLIGVLYGKVLQIQGARGINVGANALTWLKRLTLKGKDLPELYIKTREKLLAYETEKNTDVRELIREIGILGSKLGDRIELDETPTNYYLLLGQSLTTTILPKKDDEKIKKEAE